MYYYLVSIYTPTVLALLFQPHGSRNLSQSYSNTFKHFETLSY